MALQKIGERNVTALKAGTLKERDEETGKVATVEAIADNEIRGFNARRLPSGEVQFSFRYRSPENGDRLRYTIGLWGEKWPIDKARKRAKVLLGQVADNIDPIAEEKRQAAAKAAQRDRETLTVSKVCEEYFAGPGAGLWTLHELKLMYAANIEKQIGAISIYDLKRSDIATMLDFVARKAAATVNKRAGLKDRTKDPGAVAADRTLALIRRVLNWHAARSDTFVSPIVKGMARTKPKERARERSLSPTEIRAVWEGSKTVKPAVFGALVRGLFLTACRRGELAAAKWAEVRKDEEHGPVLEITVERGRAKNKKLYVVPLTDAALAELPARYEAKDGESQEDEDRRRPYIYGRAGMSAFSGFDKAKKKLDAEILKWLREEAEKRGENPKKVKPLDHWTPHDIRRTCRSIMSGEGVSNDIAERVLRHAMQGVRGVYDRYSYLPEKRAALEKLATRLAIITSDDTKKVLPLKRA